MKNTLYLWRYYVLALLFLWPSAWWLACMGRGLRLRRPLLTWDMLLIAVMLVWYTGPDLVRQLRDAVNKSLINSGSQRQDIL
ncbi:MAG: hypothetical protein H7210_10160 [Pyrinomonadaceae bacterium]|nr:hypothetical protein [Phycisphaerales bacterium]